MGRQTDIGWARSTRNFWSGCTKVSTRASGGGGCDGCYAEAASRFFAGKDPATGQARNWGAGALRIPTLPGAARDLLRWNEICAQERQHGMVHEKDSGYWDKPGFWPIFVNNFSDVLDNEVPNSWREFMWPVLEECTNLDIYLVTKRIGNAVAMFPQRWLEQGFPSHIRVIITVVNQTEADRDIPKLLRLPCKNGVSCEPALGAVDWSRWLWPMHWHWDARYKTPEDAIAAGARAHRERQALVSAYAKFLQWIIVGGASKQAGYDPPPFDVEWARSTIAHGRETGCPVFLKQLGSAPFDGSGLHDDLCAVRRGHPCNCPSAALADSRIKLKDRAGADPAEWPEALRVQEWPQ